MAAVSVNSMWGRLRAWMALDDDWVRPRPRVGRADYVFAVAMSVFVLLNLELLRSIGFFEEQPVSVPALYAASCTLPPVLLFRRRFPMATGFYSAAHLLVLGPFVPYALQNLMLQISYFVAFLSTVAWAASRTNVFLMMGLIGVGGTLEAIWSLVLGGGIQDYLDSQAPAGRPGAVPPVVALVAMNLLLNTAYFVGAVIAGQLAWRNARYKASLVNQAATIEAQSRDLRRQAVVDERLRIARELHDVVGHHVAVIGVQAAAARTVLPHEPARADHALDTIEHSARDAVSQMRHLLGTLRAMEGEGIASAGASRGPEPGIEDLESLVSAADGLDVDLEIVDQQGRAVHLPRSVGLTVYRVVQESLSNISRHSTASAASVRVRVTAEYAEVEVLDSGRPRRGSSGTGLGQLGIRERAATHNGEVEIGPRATGGYRVRVRLPVGQLQEVGADVA